MSSYASGAAAGAATGAAVAAAASARARRAECVAIEATFDARTATVEQKRDYADCIGVLYPDPMTAAETVLFKIAIVLCFVGAGIGAWFGWREDRGFGLVLGVLMGALAVVLGAGAIWLTAIGLHFVFS